MTREELQKFKDWWNLQDTGHACITDEDIDNYVVEQICFDIDEKPSPSSAKAEEILPDYTFDELFPEAEQPTAEGAEEILRCYAFHCDSSDHFQVVTYKDALAAMQEFAAQQVAESTKDCYPKGFVSWLLRYNLPIIENGERKFNPPLMTEQAFNYWKENEQ